METDFFSAAFLSALLAIVLIDLVLAGDNALIIGLVARNLPKESQNKVIFWGTFGAIAEFHQDEDEVPVIDEPHLLLRATRRAPIFPKWRRAFTAIRSSSRCSRIAAPSSGWTL